MDPTAADGFRQLAQLQSGLALESRTDVVDVREPSRRAELLLRAADSWQAAGANGLARNARFLANRAVLDAEDRFVALPRAFVDRGRIEGFAVSENEQRVVTWGASYPTTLWATVWRLDTFEPCLELKWETDSGSATGHQVAASLSIDGSRLLVTLNDRRVEVWDVVSRQHMQSIETRRGECSAARFVGLGDRILTGPGTLQWWDVATSTVTKKLKHESPIRHLAVTHDMTRAVIASNSSWELWNLHDLSRVHAGDIENIAADNRYVYGVSLLGHRDLVAVIKTNNEAELIHVYGPSSGQNVARFRHPHLTDVVSSRDGTRWITTGRDGTCRVWRLGSEEPSVTFRHVEEVRGAQFNHRGDAILTWSRDGVLCVRRTDGEQVRELRVPRSDVRQNCDDYFQDAMFLPNDDRILAWPSSGGLYLWPTSDASPVTMLSEPFADPVRGVRLLRSGMVALIHAGARLEWIPIASLPKPAPRQTYSPAPNPLLEAVLAESARFARAVPVEGSPRHAEYRVHPDGSHEIQLPPIADEPEVRLRVDPTDGRLRFKDENSAEAFWVSDRNLVVTDKGATAWWVEGMHEFVPPISGYWKSSQSRESRVRVGSFLVFYDQDYRVHCIDQNDRRRRRTFEHTRSVLGLLTLDSERVLSWSLDGTAVIWNVATGERVRTFRHELPVFEGWKIPGGPFLVTRTGDSWIRMWHAERDELQARFELPDSAEGLFVDRAGRRLFAWGTGRLRIWDLSTRRLLTDNECAMPLKVLISRDERLFVGVSPGRTLRFWSGDDGRLLFSPSLSREVSGEPHKDDVLGGVFSHDGSMFVAWGHHRFVVWDTATGKRLLVLPYAPMRPTLLNLNTESRAIFSPDDRRLLTCDGASAQLWNLRLDDEIPATERLRRLRYHTARWVDPLGRDQQLSREAWDALRAPVAGGLP